MGQKFTAVEGSLAAFHSGNEPVLLLEKPRHNLLHNLVRGTALLRRSLRESVLKVKGKMYFHGSRLGENGGGGNLLPTPYSLLPAREIAWYPALASAESGFVFKIASYWRSASAGRPVPRSVSASARRASR